MSLEFVLNVAVLLVDEVNLASENVDIVLERGVLLLRLDEGGHNLVNRSDTRAILDLLEGVLDNPHVSNVHVHQVFLFFVVVDALVEADLEQDSRIGEVSHRGLALIGADILSASLISLIFILLLQLLLKVKDAVLEVEFVHVVLGFQGKNLILGLLRQAVSSL